MELGDYWDRPFTQVYPADQGPQRPCPKCSCSGIYVDYCPQAQGGGVAVACSECEGSGWISKERAEEIHAERKKD